MPNEYATARSFKDGIEFYIPEKELVIFATRDIKGEPEIIYRKKARPVAKTSIGTKMAIVLSAVLYYLLVRCLGCGIKGEGILFLVYIWVMIFGQYFIKSKNKRNYSTFRYHGAEHKAINYYLKYGKATQDPQEIAKMGSISWACGSTWINVILLLITFVAMGWLLIPFIILKILWTILSIMIVMYLWMKGVCNLFQKFVVKLPTIKEIEVATQGLVEYVNLKEE